MAATPSLRITKTIPFKGGSRIYSNRFHFNGGTPADATHWHTLMDNVTTAEKACHIANTTIVEALGYAAGSEVPVATKVYALVGTLGVTAGDHPQAGEVAALARFSTAARSTKNHPIYLYNYFHNAVIDHTSTDYDKLAANMKTAIQTYLTSWISGFSDGTITVVRASPNGAAATGSLVEEYVTHRDFPYTTSV
jgi:hypothetical protein